MLALLGLSTVASLIVSSVLGIRLIRLWSRSRELPEGVIGCSFLAAGVFGYVITIVGNPGTTDLDPEVAYRVMATGIGLISLGVSLNYLFVWKVFRPDSRWAAALFWVGTALLAVTIAPLSGDANAQVSLGPVTLMGDLVRMGAGLWGGIEALRYYAMMRKRLQLGLAEPAVTNRFLLWGLATLTTSGIFLATSTAVRLQLAPDGSMTAEVMIVASLGAIVVAGAQWLAFLPPAAYRRWVAAGASSGA